MRHIAPPEIFFGKRIIGGADPELHGKIETRRCFTGSREAYENGIGIPVMASPRPIVMTQGKIDCFDTNVVRILVHQAVGTALDMGPTLAELGLKGLHKRLEKIQYQGIALFYEFP